MEPIVPLTLETPRLALRPFEERDCDALHEMFSDPACVQYTIEQTLAHWQTWRALASYLGHWQLRGFGPYDLMRSQRSGVSVGVGA